MTHQEVTHPNPLTTLNCLQHTLSPAPSSRAGLPGTGTPISSLAGSWQVVWWTNRGDRSHQLGAPRLSDGVAASHHLERLQRLQGSR